MRRKFLSIVLCVCMMLTMAPFAFAEGEDSETPESVVAKIGDQGYSTLQAAIKAATNTQTITLLSDIDLARTISVSNKTITLNLAGHKLYNTADLWDQPAKDDNNWSLISVRGTGNLTITGNGTLQAKENDCYAVDVQDGSTLTIENGTLVGNIHAVYVHEGTAYIKGGTYSVQQKYPQTDKGDEFVLNCYDANRRNGSATISVSGGSFTNFNPANCQAEGANTNFCAEGYSTKQEDEKYTVMGPVAAIGEHNYATLSAAVEAADNETVTLLKNSVEAITIPADKTITLDLNGHKIVNSSAPQNNTVADNLRKHTITNNGTLTIMDSVGTGVVDNVSHGRAALYNTGTISEIKGGKFTRSVDNSTDASSANGNSWYVVYNAEKAKINKISAGDFLAIGKFSSLFSNCGTIDEISGGTFKQDGFIAFKNEGTITKISGGTFSSRDESCIQNWGTIDEICGGAITAGSIGIWNFSSDTYTSAGKVTNISGGEIKGTTAAIRLNDYDATYLKPTKPSSTNIASATISGGKINGVLQVNTNTTLTITGGLFTTDPTPYCGTKDGKQLTGIPSTDSNYPFTVGTLAAANVDVAPAAPKADANTTKITDDNIKQAMTSAAASAADTSATGLDAIGGSEATKVTPEEVTQATTKLSNSGVTTTSQTVTLYVQPYLDITVTGAKVNEQQKATELSLSITPMVKKVASTAENADDIALTDETGKTKNATVISDTEVKNVNTPVTIKLALPNGFAQDKAKLSIKHTKENGSTEYYTGTVFTEGEGDTAKTYVTFTTNGFSPFVISAAAAFIGDTAYPTFQEAVENVKNDETITLAQNVATDTVVTVARTVKFSIDTSRSSFAFDKDKNIVAGSNTTVNVTGTESPYTYDFSYTRPSSGGPSSSGGSISTPTTYAVNVNAATNGAVAADKKTASKGTTVTVTASPSKGYVVDAVKVVDKDGKDVAVTEKDGKYVFTMPASAVTVTGSFKAETPAPAALPFTDVKSGNWFYDAVKYAYEQGLMTGTSATTFAPNGTMNRAMIVTVLYRLENSPAVTGASKFTDVPAGQWYSDAVAWAAANKIVNGYDETTFGPMNAVTREQMAAILFRYEQVKGLENVTLEENLNRFPDQNKISAYAIPALQWAVGQKIINGNADGTLDPTGTATRAQVAQIFTNLLNK